MRRGGWVVPVGAGGGRRARLAALVRVGVVLLAGAVLLPGCTSSPGPSPAPPATGAQSSTGSRGGPSAGSSAGRFAGSGFAACPAPTGPAVPSDGLAAVTVPCMDGSDSEVRLDRPTGRPTVVNLWGSWCPPCGRELPAFQRLHADAGGRVVVLGVVTEDSAAGSVQAARAVGVTFANVYDRGGAVRRALGVNALPVTAFVGADGRVRYVHRSAPLTDAELRRMVGRHLGVDVR